MATTDRIRAIVTVVAVGLVAVPAVVEVGEFPLSDYPIYANLRSREATLGTAVGVDAGGSTHRLSLDAIASTDDPLIAQSTVRKAIAAGDADRLCTDIAGRVDDRFVAIEVVQERHDIVRFARGDDSLLDRHVVASCDAGAG